MPYVASQLRIALQVMLAQCCFAPDDKYTGHTGDNLPTDLQLIANQAFLCDKIGSNIGKSLIEQRILKEFKNAEEKSMQRFSQKVRKFAI